MEKWRYYKCNLVCVNPSLGWSPLKLLSLFIASVVPICVTMVGSKTGRFGLKASRDLKNSPTDKSWVSFEKFRKFSIQWSPRYSNLG